jgi:hypothetical protein
LCKQFRASSIRDSGDKWDIGDFGQGIFGKSVKKIKIDKMKIHKKAKSLI